MKFEPLDPKQHDRKNFDCGVEVLNLYLQRIANQDQKRSLTRVYVLAEETRILGYYSISAHSVKRDHLPETEQKSGYEDLPFVLLGRLAVNRADQGKGFGDALIYHALRTVCYSAKQIGIMGMIVDAKDDKAAAFYEGFGFQKSTGTQNRLFLPIKTIETIVFKAGAV
jgi:predicted N-acetyltransferase YhbS